MKASAVLFLCVSIGSMSAAPDVGEKVVLSISKIDGKERQAGSVATAQGESRVVRQKSTLKTICTRIPSVSKSSGDRKTY